MKSNAPQKGAAAPRTIFIEEVSLFIGKAPTTVRICASSEKYGHLIPRPFKMPGSRRLCWYEHEVLEWIESNKPANPSPPKRPRGRPTKVEELERARWQKTAPRAGGAE